LRSQYERKPLSDSEIDMEPQMLIPEVFISNRKPKKDKKKKNKKEYFANLFKRIEENGLLLFGLFILKRLSPMLP